MPAIAAVKGATLFFKGSSALLFEFRKNPLLLLAKIQTHPA